MEHGHLRMVNSGGISELWSRRSTGVGFLMARGHLRGMKQTAGGHEVYDYLGRWQHRVERSIAFVLYVIPRLFSWGGEAAGGMPVRVAASSRSQDMLCLSVDERFNIIRAIGGIWAARESDAATEVMDVFIDICSILV